MTDAAMPGGPPPDEARPGSANGVAIHIAGQYKSVSDLDWLDVPPLAVLTGVNGAGKTQILEALYRGLTGNQGVGGPQSTKIRATIDGLQLGAGDVLFLPGLGQVGTARQMSIHTFGQLGNEIHQLLSNNPGDPDEWYYRQHLLKELGAGANPRQFNAVQLLAAVRDRPELLFRPNRPIQGLAEIFFRYRAAEFDLFQEDLDRDTIRERLGSPPWEVLNRILAAASFPYRVSSPEKLKFTEQYQLKLITDDGLELAPTDLSSGERAFLTLVMWLYGSRDLGSLPKLLLMDEPDAFLHPSLTRRFIDVVHDVLVQEMGIRVIMTTHSPSTVAQVPDGSLFEVRKTAPRIRAAADRWAAVDLLTEGVVAVGPDARFVFVEDAADRDFYHSCFDALKRLTFADGRTPLALGPRLVFVPASLGAESGGRQQVIDWVTNMEGSHIGGIIDGDAGSESPLPARVQRLSRYEPENYLLDPLIVFCWLAENKKAPKIDGLDLAFGEERALATQPQTTLQRIVDTNLAKLLAQASAVVPTPDVTVEDVALVSGQILQYPRWFLATKGKRLLGPAQAAFDKRLSIEGLRLTAERIALLPADILALLLRAQGRAPDVA